LARDPGVDLLGGLRAGCKVVANRLRVDLCVGADGGREEEEDWGSLELKLVIVNFPTALATSK
jgi:hypothetical protein